jgi:acetyl-CoA carboxylase biotin carboxyl carrier protein
MRAHDLSEIEVTDGQERIKLGRSAAVASGPMMAHPMMDQMQMRAPMPVSNARTMPQQTSSAEAPKESKANQKHIKSPFVGTFYLAPKPGAEPFVRPGQRVKKGDVLCIVEAMKLMNEIESEIDGTIVEVLVDNGKPIEFDQPLFVYE